MINNSGLRGRIAKISAKILYRGPFCTTFSLGCHTQRILFLLVKQGFNTFGKTIRHKSLLQMTG
jgi:hypothetical protein